MKDYMRITIMVPSKQKEEVVHVQPNTRTYELFIEVCNYFSIDPKRYALYLRDGESKLLLHKDRMLWQNNVYDGATLLLEKETPTLSQTPLLISKGERYYFESTVLVSLIEQVTRRTFRLEWQPAIIGRKDDENPAKNGLLAVDLSRLDTARSVSRHHAVITRKDGQYYLESLSTTKKTYLNGEPIGDGRYPISPGNHIRVGSFTFIFNLVQ